MQSIFSWLVALALTLATTATAQAATVTYKYEGALFDRINDATGSLNAYDRFTVAVTFDQPYPNGVAYGNNIVAFSLTGNGVSPVTQLNATLDIGNSYFLFDGDKIDTWFLIFNMQNPANGTYTGFTTAHGSDERDNIRVVDITGVSNRLVGVKTVLDMPGNWTLQTTASPVPEPESYGLMLLGLSLVGAAVRRRKQA